MKLDKKISIELVDDAREAFEKLNSVVGLQHKKGMESSEEITLLRGIQEAFDFIEDNPFYGRHVKKKQMPKEYVQKYDVDNLFIANLPGYWRMIYTLQSDKVEIVAFVLDIYSHKEYDKKFGYK